MSQRIRDWVAGLERSSNPESWGRVSLGPSHPNRLRAGPRRVPHRGAVIVEVALVLGIVFLFLFGIFEYSRLLMTYNVTENAARAGARHAAVQFTANRSSAEIAALTTEIEDLTRSVMGGVDTQLEGLDIEVLRLDPLSGADGGPWSSARFAEPVAVRITGNYRPRVRLFMPATVPIRLQAFMASEAN